MKPQNNKNIIWGSLIILAGLLFLAAEFNYLDFNLYQAIFVNHLWLVGLGAFLVFKNRPNVIFGITFATLGILFFASDMGYISHVHWGTVWPIFLVAARFQILLTRRGTIVNA